jgi:hypothetical protein
MASKQERQFQAGLRERIGMKDTSPATAIGDAWGDMESALAAVQPHLQLLGEAVQGDAELEEAVSVAIQGTAEGFQAAAEALESVETSLVEAGLLDPEDTEAFEPSQEADG